MLPSLFISHGSPMLALQPGASGPALAGLANALPRPQAIVLVSAHWESRELLITGGAHPETWHDFYGFPPALYAVQYPAPGDPALAGRVGELLQGAGLAARLDPQRPFDHGAWVPLSLMYPDASIPVVQVSLPTQMGPALQVKVGQALAGLRQEGVLLVGSGSITHNLGELDWHAGPDVIEPWALAFRDWVVEKLRADDREGLLAYRQQAPFAVRNHPSDEHLLPLFFALGAGGQFGVVHQGFTLGALGMDIYRFD
ncbi:DODA-type extradiol aromatic ring-opening family dioxygenase [Pseudomonas juntendi]|uniref:Class III extradiol ring-cleavage dioxygenase n=1 Tax=Pseudomonas juntendi TaxID=2666183 RepID=A0AAJ5UWJ0_9PSED|nr:class III extradiol ring-cleavage dioxygenase [Pseudomonas juntendi]QOH71053.1 dioxygenase [Pseudomonas putida]MCO7059104.1 dioxygenase [Pseudomonas juntendi]MDM3889402.1 class III extradiol ring-cleavage dioxygenase [Pseudomonas juntendi]UJM11339.1 dioxygenase [Pseudomonas juntendi]UXA37429.1 dioxygenase [Pseudomonas juntendi]